jgi:hypothetical protein
VVPLIAVLHDRTGGFAALFGVLAGAAALVALASLLLPGRLRAPGGAVEGAGPGPGVRAAP